MKAAWYPVLQWAARRGEGRPFSTLELAEHVGLPAAADDDADAAWSLRKSRAHAVTQKLWKWGYLRKREGPGPLDDGDPAPARRRGRPVAFWSVTNKGVRRASRPYVQRFFPSKRRR